MIKTYSSIDQFRAESIKLSATGRHTHSVSWYGGETVEDTLRLSLSGDAKLVPEAEKLISQLELGLETSRKEWAASPAGVYCSVPDLIAGRPAPMRRLIETADERAPIELYNVLSCSGGIDVKTLIQRGSIVLALTMALIRTRPVSLHLVDIGDGIIDKSGETVITVRVNTAPLDLARTCYAMTSAGFVRRMMYGMADKLNGFTGKWPTTKLWSYGKPKPYHDDLLQRLSSDPNSALMIPGAQLGDEMLKDPLTWLKDKITWFTEREEEY